MPSHRPRLLRRCMHADLHVQYWGCECLRHFRTLGGVLEGRICRCISCADCTRGRIKQVLSQHSRLGRARPKLEQLLWAALAEFMVHSACVAPLACHCGPTLCDSRVPSGRTRPSLVCCVPKLVRAWAAPEIHKHTHTHRQNTHRHTHTHTH